MRDILLSVITPCYNSADSLINYYSTLENNEYLIDDVEFIVVDDCSPDNSYDKLVDFKKNSSLNLKVFRNNCNSGPGASRNVGISCSSGKYITFLDSDDYFSDRFFEIVKPYLLATYDCIIFDYQTVEGSKIKQHSIRYDGFSSKEPSMEEVFVFVRGSTCGKIYLSSIVKNNNIQFPDLTRNEDMPFTKTTIYYCKSILHINQPLYNYVQNKNSLMHNKKLLDKKNAQRAFDYICNKIKDNHTKEVDAVYLREYVYSTCLTALHEYSRKEWNEYVDMIETKRPIDLNNPYFQKNPKLVKILIKWIKKRRYYSLLFVEKVKSVIR